MMKLVARVKAWRGREDVKRMLKLQLRILRELRTTS